MRTRTGTHSNRAACLALALAPLFGELAQGQQLTWDASGASPTAATDGSGTWSTTAANWTDGVTNTVWVNGDFAGIGNGGTPGTITIDDPSGSVTAAGILFNSVSSGSYTIAANGSNALNLVSGASLNFAAGASAKISAPISGSVGLTAGGGTLTLAGQNTFTGPVQINSGTLTIAAGGNLGDSGNAVSLGTPTDGTSSGNPTAGLVVEPSVTTTVGSFKTAVNNTTNGSTLTIGSAAALSVNSNLDGSGINAAFVIGNSNRNAAMTTLLTVNGGGALNVSGGTNNSSFLVGLGNANNTSGNIATGTLDMSGLANFSFVTGTGAAPGNEFAVSHGTNVTATAYLAQNNTITAGTITVADSSSTPGLTPAGVGATNSPGVLNLGSGSNVFNCNALNIGAGRVQGTVQWLTGTGSLLVTGAAGGASVANVTVGALTGGTPASSASQLDLTGHTVTFQGGTIIVGELAGGTGGTSGTKGGQILFDTGTFNIVDLRLAVGLSGTSGGSIAGTFTVGSGPSSTGMLNVANSFFIGDVTGGSAGAKGTLNIKGGTANVGANIIDVSTANTSSTTVALTGGTLNMGGFAIGPSTAVGNSGPVGTRHLSTITFPGLGNSAVLANLGGTGINDAGLTMNAAGTLVLEGSNTYSGTTTISAGTLQVGQAGDTVPPSSALPASVIDNSMLSFGSNQSLTNSTAISGTGGVGQNGTGITSLAGNSSYTGPTLLVNGVLSVASLPSEGAGGGTNSPIGASSNAASKLVLTGGTLQYAGAGGSTDRLFTVTATGGGIDASGSGPIAFNNGGAIVSADPAPRATTDSATSAKVTLPSVADLVVGMTVTGTNIPAGTTIVSINPTASSITLSNIPSAAGADTLSFGTVNRTLTLTGTNTGANVLGNSLSNSPGGGTLSLTKSGSGAWSITAANAYTGVTTVQGGTLTAVGSAAWAPALANSNITGGRLVFDYSADASPAGTISTALTGSYLSGFTTGPLKSTTATTTKGLGWKDDPGAKKVTVMLTYFGDADLDGQVTTGDFTTLAQNFNSAGTWATGDFNYDGVVNALDFNAVATNFGAGALPAKSLGSVVPEPASIGLLVITPAMWMRRRRR